MGTGKCTDVLVLLPPSSANNAAPKSVKVKSNIKAAINQAALTCNECHAVRVRVCRVLNGGHWRLLRALYDRRRPVQAAAGECERGSTTKQRCKSSQAEQNAEGRSTCDREPCEWGAGAKLPRACACSWEEGVAEGTAHEQTGMQPLASK